MANLEVPQLELSPADLAFVSELSADIESRFPNIPTDTQESGINFRKTVTAEVTKNLGDTVLGADLGLDNYFNNPNVPAILIQTNEQKQGFSDNRQIIAGRIALIGIGRGIGRIAPNAYEDGGDEVGFIIPTEEARDSISSNGSDIELMPHQEVSQKLDESGTALSGVDLYKSVVLHCVRDSAQRPTPSRVLSTTAMVEALTDEERAVLGSPQFMFKTFDIIKKQAGRDDIEPLTYAPLSEDGVTTIDLDDTVGITPEAKAVMEKLRQLSRDGSGLVATADIIPGRIIAVNNKFALHGRSPIPWDPSQKGKERLLQRTQIA